MVPNRKVCAIFYIYILISKQILFIEKPRTAPRQKKNKIANKHRKIARHECTGYTASAVHRVLFGFRIKTKASYSFEDRGTDRQTELISE